MTKEIQSPNVERLSAVRSPVSLFGIGNGGSWRAPFRFSACIGTMKPLTAWSPGFSRSKRFVPPVGGTPNQAEFIESLPLIAERVVGAVVIGHGPEIERIQQAPILDKPRAAVGHHV